MTDFVITDGPAFAGDQFNELCKAEDGDGPSGRGWSKIPGGAKGGFRRRHNGGWQYYYPHPDGKPGKKVTKRKAGKRRVKLSDGSVVHLSADGHYGRVKLSDGSSHSFGPSVLPMDPAHFSGPGVTGESLITPQPDVMAEGRSSKGGFGDVYDSIMREQAKAAKEGTFIGEPKRAWRSLAYTGATEAELDAMWKKVDELRGKMTGKAGQLTSDEFTRQRKARQAQHDSVDRTTGQDTPQHRAATRRKDALTSIGHERAAGRMGDGFGSPQARTVQRSDAILSGKQPMRGEMTGKGGRGLTAEETAYQRKTNPLLGKQLDLANIVNARLRPEYRSGHSARKTSSGAPKKMTGKVRMPSRGHRADGQVKLSTMAEPKKHTSHPEFYGEHPSGEQRPASIHERRGSASIAPTRVGRMTGKQYRVSFGPAHGDAGPKQATPHTVQAGGGSITSRAAKPRLVRPRPSSGHSMQRSMGTQGDEFDVLLKATEKPYTGKGKRAGEPGHYSYTYDGASGGRTSSADDEDHTDIPEYKLRVTQARRKEGDPPLGKGESHAEIAAKLKQGISDAADLCKDKPSVCAGNLGILREDMPQFDAEANPDVVEEYLQEFRDEGVKVTSGTTMKVGKLKATQQEIKTSKSYGMAESRKKWEESMAAGNHGMYDSGGKFGMTDWHPAKDAVVVSADGYILDGHHRWAAMMIANPNASMPVHVVDAPIRALLAKSEKFYREGRGVKKAGFAAESIGVKKSMTTGQVWVTARWHERINRLIKSANARMAAGDEFDALRRF